MLSPSNKGKKAKSYLRSWICEYFKSVSPRNVHLKKKIIEIQDFFYSAGSKYFCSEPKEKCVFLNKKIFFLKILYLLLRHYFCFCAHGKNGPFSKSLLQKILTHCSESSAPLGKVYIVYRSHLYEQFDR